jgi:hypothetical protein
MKFHNCPEPTPEGLPPRNIDSSHVGFAPIGDVVPVPLNDTECIFIRKDVFDRMKHVAYDDSEWTPEEMAAAATHPFNSADTAGPIQ